MDKYREDWAWAERMERAIDGVNVAQEQYDDAVENYEHEPNDRHEKIRDFCREILDLRLEVYDNVDRPGLARKYDQKADRVQKQLNYFLRGSV